MGEARLTRNDSGRQSPTVALGWPRSNRYVTSIRSSPTVNAIACRALGSVRQPDGNPGKIGVLTRRPALGSDGGDERVYARDRGGGYNLRRSELTLGNHRS